MYTGFCAFKAQKSMAKPLQKATRLFIKDYEKKQCNDVHALELKHVN